MGAASVHLYRIARTASGAGIVVWAALGVVLLLALAAILVGPVSDPSNSDGLFAPFRWNPLDPQPMA
jgi:hypothetical protein